MLDKLTVCFSVFQTGDCARGVWKADLLVGRADCFTAVPTPDFSQWFTHQTEEK